MQRVHSICFRCVLLLVLVPMPLFAQRIKVVEVAPTSPTAEDEAKLAQSDDPWVNETGDTMTGTLTLNPSEDRALDLASGSIYKGGALFIHTKGGGSNVAIGRGALSNVTSGTLNTASGLSALYNNTSGFGNTATGVQALRANTTGWRNTACGAGALSDNRSGYGNTATGRSALFYNTTGAYNTASGRSALFNNTTGNNNIAVGHRAGANLRAGSNNIAIGNSGIPRESGTIRIGVADSARAFIAGIRGVTTNEDAIPVVIDSAGQLGTITSSRRFKEDIVDMGDATDRLLDLRAVLFRYKERNVDGNGPLEFGLIAEEVAEIFPELVVYDEEGEPFTVKYHLLSTMLLNELQKEHARVDDLAVRIAALEQRE